MTSGTCTSIVPICCALVIFNVLTSVYRTLSTAIRFNSHHAAFPGAEAAAALHPSSTIRRLSTSCPLSCYPRLSPNHRVRPSCPCLPLTHRHTAVTSDTSPRPPPCISSWILMTPLMSLRLFFPMPGTHHLRTYGTARTLSTIAARLSFSRAPTPTSRSCLAKSSQMSSRTANLILCDDVYARTLDRSWTGRPGALRSTSCRPTVVAVIMS
jgi:hypothetical protein